MIYFDNSATTQTRKEVAQLIADYSVNEYFNPSSSYAPALKVKNDIDNVRQVILSLLNADKFDKIIFTGSATEANNLVLNGFVKKNKKILITNGEHPSIFETAKNLKNLGYNVEFIELKTDGRIDEDDLLKKLSFDVCLVSLIHVSNETGAINDINKICKLVKNKVPTAIVHCDGVQAFGKVKINLTQSNIDAYTISSHKIHGPKGVACLYLKNGLNIKPHILGGGQEGGLRSGTENTSGIIGFGKACQLMYENFEEKRQHIKALKAYLLSQLEQSDLEYNLNSTNTCLENIVSLYFANVRGEVLLHSLEKYGIYVSTGSACSSKIVGNRVLTSMHQDKQTMLGNIRVSFSEFNTKEEVDTFLQALKEVIPLIKH